MKRPRPVVTRVLNGEGPIRTYTVGDLRHVPPGTIQYCRSCHGEYSATHGDYFILDDATPLTCCDRPIALVTKRDRVYRGPLTTIVIMIRLPGMAAYLLRDIDDDLWRQVKVKAATIGLPIRTVLVELLKQFVK